MLLARDVPDAHPLALDHDPGIDGFKGFVLHQMMPHMGAVGRDQVLRIVGGVQGIHVGLHQVGGGGRICGAV